VCRGRVCVGVWVLCVCVRVCREKMEREMCVCTERVEKGRVEGKRGGGRFVRRQKSCYVRGSCHIFNVNDQQHGNKTRHKLRVHIVLLPGPTHLWLHPFPPCCVHSLPSCTLAIYTGHQKSSKGDNIAHSPSTLSLVLPCTCRYSGRASLNTK